MTDKNKLIPIGSVNPIQQNLDYVISEVILNFAKDHPITNADVAGVLEAIKFRMFDEGI